ncbi:MAG: hypothetical protein JAZ17_26770 [Candidatus Thiodiazotropha endolucinida]|nr:hypothetical protein [Candidatus Thiodiazotropha endolucinida]
MPIWEILFLMSVVVGLFWILYGTGKKSFRLAVGSCLSVVIVLLWGLAFSGLFSDSVSYVLGMLALLGALVLLFLPMAHKAFLSKM